MRSRIKNRYLDTLLKNGNNLFLTPFIELDQKKLDDNAVAFLTYNRAELSRNLHQLLPLVTDKINNQNKSLDIRKRTVSQHKFISLLVNILSYPKVQSQSNQLYERIMSLVMFNHNIHRKGVLSPRDEQGRFPCEDTCCIYS